MKARHAFAIVVAVLVLGPVGLSIGTYFLLLLVPVALLLLPALLLFSVAMLPVLLSGGRAEEPVGPRPQFRVPSTVGGSG